MRGSSGAGVFWWAVEMGGESLLLPVWRSVGGGFTGRGKFDAWVVRAVILCRDKKLNYVEREGE